MCKVSVRFGYGEPAIYQAGLHPPGALSRSGYASDINVDPQTYPKQTQPRTAAAGEPGVAMEVDLVRYRMRSSWYVYVNLSLVHQSSPD